MKTSELKKLIKEIISEVKNGYRIAGKNVIQDVRITDVFQAQQYIKEFVENTNINQYPVEYSVFDFDYRSTGELGNKLQRLFEAGYMLTTIQTNNAANDKDKIFNVMLYAEQISSEADDFVNKTGGSLDEVYEVIPNLSAGMLFVPKEIQKQILSAIDITELDDIKRAFFQHTYRPLVKKGFIALYNKKLKELNPTAVIISETIKKVKFSELIDLYKDQIPGGKADSKSPEQFDRRQLIIGFYVEAEHSNDMLKRIEIACDHLTEDEEYYTKLIKSGVVDEPKAIDAYKRFYGDI